MKVHGSAYQVAGVPDIVGVFAGHFVGLEVKLPGLEQTVSSRQAYIMSKIQDAGGVVAVISSDLDAVRVIYEIGTNDG